LPLGEPLVEAHERVVRRERRRRPGGPAGACFGAVSFIDFMRSAPRGAAPVARPGVRRASALDERARGALPLTRPAGASSPPASPTRESQARRAAPR
jgi:hypothetical protein